MADEVRTKRILCGRKVIYTDADVITPANVIEILNRSQGRHNTNRGDIEYLYKYYRGLQPILNKTKEYNEFVNNKIVINRANEIVTFKTSFLMSEPIQYTARKAESNITDAINLLNDYCYSEFKDTKDVALADWFHICGTAYRMILPDPVGAEDDSPFEIYTLDPRNTYVVYHSGLGHKPMMGVTFVEREDIGDIVYSVYTEDAYYEIINGQITRYEAHFLGDIPIIEYPANESRLGAFEIVIDMLDAINQVESDRLDAVDQFVQSLTILKGVDIDDDAFWHLREVGGIKVPVDGDVSFLTQEMNQQQSQTLSDAMYDAVLSICGIPCTSDGSTSDSSNNGATIVRNGWQHAEARAKDSERMFKMSEKRFLKIALKICGILGDLQLKVGDVDITFTRRYYENNLQKAQTLISMLSSNKIHPRLAFIHSGLFIDPESAYRMSDEYAEEQEQKAQKMLELQAEKSEVEEEKSEGDSNENEKSEELPDEV